MSFNYGGWGGVGIRNLITMTLGDMIESYAYGVEGGLARKIEYARPLLFDFDYPIINEDEKKRFETNFIRRFYSNEIGFETEGLFKFELETWLQINMPYWNKLLESQVWEATITNPLQNYDLTETSTTNTSGLKTIAEEMSSEREKEMDATSVKTETSSDNLNKTATGTHNTTISDEQSINVTASSETEKDAELTTNVADSGSITEAGTTETSSDSTSTKNNFDRNLSSDTPDNRLSITPNPDGSGVIEYASSIQENKNTGSETLIGTESVENDKSTTISNTSDTTTSDKGVESTTKNEDTTTSKDVTDTGTTTASEFVTESGTSSSNDTQNVKDGETVNETKDTTENDTQTVEHTLSRVGAIGVARYDELLNGYREIFKNYDNMIFDAMHTELFMLVY